MIELYERCFRWAEAHERDEVCPSPGFEAKRTLLAVTAIALITSALVPLSSFAASHLHTLARLMSGIDGGPFVLLAGVLTAWLWVALLSALQRRQSCGAGASAGRAAERDVLLLRSTANEARPQ
jgi:hypothetical protein